MNTITTTTTSNKNKYWIYKQVTVPCTFNLQQVANLLPGDSSWVNENTLTQRVRTTTKRIVTQTYDYGATISSEVTNTLSAGVSLPVDVVEVSANASVEVKAAFESSFNNSLTTSEGYEEEKETTMEQKFRTTYTADKQREVIVYVQSVFYGRTKVSKMYLVKYRTDWDTTDKSGDFSVTMKVATGYQWYNIRSRGGLNVAVRENTPKKGEGVFVWDPLSEAGQKWRFDRDHLVTKIGESQHYLAVSENRGGEAVDVCLWSKLPENGQRWTQEGTYIKNGNGYYLAVAENGGKGYQLIVFRKKENENGQHWSFIESN